MKDKFTIRTFLGQTIEVSADQLEWRPGVYGIVLHQGCVLLVKMKRNEQFVLPGGGIELGEQAADALRREMKEETGIDVTVGELIDVLEDFFHYDPSGRSYHALGFYYRCEAQTFDLAANDAVDDEEVESPQWVTVEELSAEAFFYKPTFTLNLIQKAANGEKR